jgi:hypothetical protein
MFLRKRIYVTKIYSNIYMYVYTVASNSLTFLVYKRVTRTITPNAGKNDMQLNGSRHDMYYTKQFLKENRYINTILILEP